MIHNSTFRNKWTISLTIWDQIADTAISKTEILFTGVVGWIILFYVISNNLLYFLHVCLIAFDGMSTFVGYLMPNPILYNKQLYFKQFWFV